MIRGILHENDDIKVKGNWITCKFCHKKFKFKEKKYRKNWENKHRYQCPYCETLYCILPKTEMKLRVLQDDYFESNRNEKYLNKIFYILVDYAQSMIKKNFGKKHNFVYGLLEEYACDAASLLLEKYIDSEFKVHTTFGKLLYYKILERMFGKKYHVICDETINYKFEDDNYIDYIDDREGFLSKIYRDECVDCVIDEVCSLIFSMEKISNSQKEEYYRLLATLIYLRDGESSYQRFYKKINNKCGKESSLRTIDELHNLLNVLNGKKDARHIIADTINEQLIE